MVLLLSPRRRWRRSGWAGRWRRRRRAGWRTRRRWRLAGALGARLQLARFLTWIEHAASRVVDLRGHGRRGGFRGGRLGYFSANRSPRTAAIRLTLLGGDFLGAAAVGGEIAPIDPYLDADDAVGGVGFGLAVIDVG